MRILFEYNLITICTYLLIFHFWHDFNKTGYCKPLSRYFSLLVTVNCNTSKIFTFLSTFVCWLAVWRQLCIQLFHFRDICWFKEIMCNSTSAWIAAKSLKLQRNYYYMYNQSFNHMWLKEFCKEIYSLINYN